MWKNIHDLINVWKAQWTKQLLEDDFVPQMEMACIGILQEQALGCLNYSKKVQI